ncbi:YagK/YfjJ domain-containing protein [Aeromonas caviae]|uniref:YagK/YfjJ domain-containing protein n=1 Tax=Aeromonas caviae TaxID=648 RepID=UPI00069A7EEC|nr:inovirus-type Gp2 protein [Aeromonas caviae]
MENTVKYKLNDMGEDGNLDTTTIIKMIRQVETLSNRYSKLLVVRVDLHVPDDVWLNDSKLIDKLLKNIRKTKYKDHLFGYFWVLEREKRKKGHYHMVFFFDGQKRQSQWAAQTMIEGCWLRVGCELSAVEQYTAPRVLAQGCYCMAISRKERIPFTPSLIYVRNEARSVLKRGKGYTDSLAYLNCQ